MAKPNLSNFNNGDLNNHKARDVYQAYKDENPNTKDSKIILDLLRRIAILEKKLANLEKRS